MVSRPKSDSQVCYKALVGEPVKLVLPFQRLSIAQYTPKVSYSIDAISFDPTPTSIHTYGPRIHSTCYSRKHLS